MRRNEMIVRLCEAVEKLVGCKMTTPSNFEMLRNRIIEWQHVTISASTLKRIWGYAGQTTEPRVIMLDTLARLVGYKDFDAFCQGQARGAEVESQLFLSGTINADQLEPGANLHLSWQPDRVCIVEHQGGGVFRVVKAENTKLQENDTFECHLFINHEPLYIDRLCRGSLPPVSYVAGRQNGVTVRIIEK